MVWELHEGDCLEVLKTLPDGSVDVVITDPPYGIALAVISQGGRHGRARKAWQLEIAGDHNSELGQYVLDWVAERRLPTVAFASPKRPWLGKWRQCLVWDKGGGVGGGGDIRRTWKNTWEMIQIRDTGVLAGGRDSAVLRYTVGPQLSQQHPAAKPVELMRYLIRKTVPPGGTVLDPFAGSGTTGIACELEGRNSILIERVPEYCGIIRKRLSEVNGPLFTQRGDS